MEFENLQTLLNWFETIAKELIAAIDKAVKYFTGKYEEVKEDE